MATKADRGTKRTCQDANCGVRFYDLARDPITCPTCGAAYTVVVRPPPTIGRPVKKYKFVAPETAPTEEEVDTPAVDAGDDAGGEVILEEQEDDADVSGIIDEPAKEES